MSVTGRQPTKVPTSSTLVPITLIQEMHGAETILAAFKAPTMEIQSHHRRRRIHRLHSLRQFALRKMYQGGSDVATRRSSLSSYFGIMKLYCKDLIRVRYRERAYIFDCLQDARIDPRRTR